MLIAGDIPFLILLLKMSIEDAEFNVIASAASPEEMLIKCRETDPDVVIFDFQLSERKCVRLVEDILDIDPGIAIIVITDPINGYDEKLLVSGARAFLQKPFSTYDIMDLLTKVSPLK